MIDDLVTIMAHRAMLLANRPSAWSMEVRDAMGAQAVVV